MKLVKTFVLAGVGLLTLARVLFAQSEFSIYTPSTQYNYWISSAFDGQNFLVVWVSEGELAGVRINQSGQILDSIPFFISNTCTYQTMANPILSFDGINYFIVWEDTRFNEYPYDVFGARISNVGEVLDPQGINLSAFDNPQLHNAKSPCVAFDGTNYFVVWDGKKGARVNKQGIPLDTVPLPLSSTPGVGWFPSSAFNGINYLVVWIDQFDTAGLNIYGALVTPEGQVLNSSDIQISSNHVPAVAKVASDGKDFFVVWEESYPEFTVYGARVSGSGEVLDPEGIKLVRNPDLHNLSTPSVGFDGANYLVAFTADNYNPPQAGIYGVLVDAQGQVTFSVPSILSSSRRDIPWVVPVAANKSLIIYRSYEGIKGTFFENKLIPGDVNWDFRVSISDPICLINYLFKGGSLPNISRSDCNCDGKLSISEAVFLINYLFKGGPAPERCE